ncbi:MAG: hypothetical protein Q8N36_01915, partial [bacterium]|nr:hypothetical protein [bacterium]
MTMLSSFLTKYFTRYPQAQVEDIYKTLHQICLGSEHAVASYAQVFAHLRAEWETLSGVNDEPLL